MGEARRKRGSDEPLTEEQRSKALGVDPFQIAYDTLFGGLSKTYAVTGEIVNQLVGFEFVEGEIVSLNVVLVRRIEDVPRLRSHMIERWPMVAHVFPAWAAPDTSVAPSQHAKRRDVIAVMLHTLDLTAAATCPADPKNRTLVQERLILPDRITGRLSPGLSQPKTFN